MWSKLLAMKISGLGVSQVQVAVLARVRENDLNNFLRGTSDLSNEKLLRIRDVVSDLERLAEIARPFEVSFKDTNHTRTLIAKLHDGEFNR